MTNTTDAGPPAKLHPRTGKAVDTAMLKIDDPSVPISERLRLMRFVAARTKSPPKVPVDPLAWLLLKPKRHQKPRQPVKP